MRAVSYARVSTDDQAERGYSIPTQFEANRKYAADHNIIIVAEITDDYSGTKLDRPGLDQVRALIQRREVDAVIIFATDRLTRRLAHLLILREEFQRAEIELHFVRRGKSEDTPENRMMENIEGVFNEYWREKIIESSRRGMLGKAKDNKVVGVGPSLYGYDYSCNALIINEAEAEIVRLIYLWYTEGDEDSRSMTLWRIAKRLSELGVSTPGERRGRPRKRGAGIWNVTIISRILENETYAGVWHWGKHIGNGGKGGKRPREEQVAVNVPAIVDRAIWEAAQEQRAYNKKMSKRNTKEQYLLRGMAECDCGRAIVAHKRPWGASYYRCGSHYSYMPGLEERTCGEKSVRKEILEEKVWGDVLQLMNDPCEFESRLRRAQEAERIARQPKQERLDAVNRLVEKCKREAEELISVLPSAMQSGLMNQTIQERIAKLEEEHKALVRERDNLVDELKKIQMLTDDEVQAALRFREDVIAGMQNPTFEDKRRILEVLRVRVIVKDQIGTVYYRLLVKQGQILDGHTGSHTATNYLKFHSCHPRLSVDDSATTCDGDECRRCPIPRS